MKKQTGRAHSTRRQDASEGEAGTSHPRVWTMDSATPETRKARFPKLFESKVAVVGAALFCIVAMVSLCAPLIATYPHDLIDPTVRLLPPSPEHYFGTDHLGRDIFSRTLYGGRVTLAVSLLVTAITTVAGSVLGVLAGYYSRLDNIFMRLMDGLMAFPAILLAIALVASLGPTPANVVIALSVVYMPRVARIARASTLTLREQAFVEAARALGSRDLHIIARHIAPNAIGAITVQVTFVFAYAVLAEASLSFLGVGTPPNIPTWGNILSAGRPYLTLAPWITLIPGIAIMLVVLSLNLMGDGLRDLLDPRLRNRDS